MTTWFTSDLHLRHTNIIKYCARPWTDAAAMDEALIANWNAVVAPEDEVWNLGDVALGSSSGAVLDQLRRLNGMHHVVAGNHDALTRRLWCSVWSFGLASLHEGIVKIEVEGQQIVLCHYAMREWHHALRGVWHLFGHTHGGLRPFGKSVDVGVDNVSEIVPGALYRPVSFAEVKAFMAARPIGDHPKFDNFYPNATS